MFFDKSKNDFKFFFNINDTLSLSVIKPSFYGCFVSNDEGVYFNQKAELLDLPLIQINSDVTIMTQLNQILQEYLGFTYESESPPHIKLDILLNKVGIVRVYLFRTSQLQPITPEPNLSQIVSFERLSQMLISPDPTQEPLFIAGRRYFLSSEVIHLVGLMEPTLTVATKLHKIITVLRAELQEKEKLKQLNATLLGKLNTQAVDLKVKFDQELQKALIKKEEEKTKELAEIDEIVDGKNQTIAKLGAEKDRALAEKDKLLSEKDRSLAEKEKLLSEKDRALAEKDRALAEKTKLLADSSREISIRDEKWQKFFSKPYHLDQLNNNSINTENTQVEPSLGDIVTHNFSKLKPNSASNSTSKDVQFGVITKIPTDYKISDKKCSGCDKFHNGKIEITWLKQDGSRYSVESHVCVAQHQDVKIIAKFKEIKLNKIQVPMTKEKLDQLANGDRIKLKATLTASETSLYTNGYSWNSDKQKLLGQWVQFDNLASNNEFIQLNDHNYAFHWSHFELVEITKKKRVQVPLTKEILSKLEKNTRLKLKATLTESDRDLIRKHYYWTNDKDQLLGKWVKFTRSDYSDYMLVNDTYGFHWSNFELVEIDSVESGESEESVTEEASKTETMEAKFAKVKAEFDLLVGRQTLKDNFLEFFDQSQINRKRLAAGLKVKAGGSHHMVFMGRPGTGKTLLAKTFGRALFHLGVVPEDKFLAVGRADLVGAYVGHTETKTQAILQKIKGGVLFIDEAYALNSFASDSIDYGRKAVETILLFMEENREDTVIIFAGYGQEMNQFLASNPGLESRIPYVFDFPDYSKDELWDIFQYELEQHGYKLTDLRLKEAFYTFLNTDQYNGREIRNIVERLIKAQAVRLAKKLKLQPTYELTRQEFIDISVDDLMGVLESFRPTRFDRSQSQPSMAKGSNFTLNIDPRVLQALFSMNK